MNNDITIKRIPVTSFLEHFNDPSLFAVTMQSLNPKTKEFREGAKGCRFVAGFIKILHAKRHTPLKQDYGIPSLYPVGGHCVLRRSMFLDLGGLDPLFSPFYWEDTDLGYRAWKKGWKTVYAPDVEVFHDEQGTILGSHKKAFIQTVRYRNRLLFIWKNMDDKGLLAVHLCFLFLRMLFSWAWCDFKFYRYLTGALLKLPAALRARRRRIKRGEKADDKWLIRTFK
jgi:GT2 family glycosyltransferase